MAYIDSKGDLRLNKPTHFFDLPQEVRDMIYAYFPYLASIHINQDPSKLVQPNVSKVCRRMREESLNVFYGRNKFVLDLRGWKHGSYPRRWTPFEVFGHWITTIGDQNARRIRNLTFFSHNFRLNVRVSNEVPPSIALRLRTNPARTEVADYVPSWYTFEVAAERAEKGLKEIVGRLLAKSQKTALTSSDFLAISTGVDDVQPFLCRRMSLGYQGTALLDDDMPMDAWPDTTAHTDKCDDCGYHRYTRGYE
jgi:hypothetical protein